MVVRPHWGGETGSPPLKSSGFFIDDRGYIGGRGIARPPSSSQLPRVLLRRRCVLRWRKDCTSGLPPHTAGFVPQRERDRALLLTTTMGTSEEEGQVLLLTMLVSFLRRTVVTQMGRSGETMICEKATLCTRVQVGTARDVLRHHAMGVQVDHGQDQAGLPTVGTFRRYHPYGRYAVDDLGTLRRYRGSCVWKAPYKSERSGRTAIPCSGWARSFTGGTAALPTVATLQRYHRLDRCWFVDTTHGWGTAQVGRSGDTMVCGLDVAFPRVLVSPLRALCVTIRWVCGTSWSC